MQMPLNDESMITTTKNDKNNAEQLIRNHSKRLAKKQTEKYKNAAAYLIVVGNNHSSKSGRSRRKRSAEFATLEPIDENSLTALRKVYKNALKEITLNPNESPAEALMRYNAESIREALEKANRQPLEVTAGQEDEQIKGNNKLEKKMDQQQAMFQQKISKQQLPHGYAFSDNHQFLPITTGPETSANNAPYIYLPAGMQQPHTLPVSFNHQPTVMYDSAQEGVYNNMISKYNTPAVYSSNNKYLTQNPFLSINNPVETLPFIDEYSVVNQPYQLAEGAEKAGKFIVYQRSDSQPPHLSYNDFMTPSNAINKNMPYLPTSGHHIRDYDKTKMWQYDNFIRELPLTKTDYNSDSHFSNKNGNLDTYSELRQQPIELSKNYRSARSQESSSSSLGNIIDVIKEQLDQCCNTCKDNILKRLDEILLKNIKTQNTFRDVPHTLTYRKTNSDADSEYKQWLLEMSEKGYDKEHLTKQHQKDYLKDGKLNLHVAGDHGFSRPVEHIFFKNDQSYKRESTISEPRMMVHKGTKVVTPPIEYVSKIKEDENEEAEDEQEETADEKREDENQTKTQKPSNFLEHSKKPQTTIRNETKMGAEKEKNNTIDKKDTNWKDQQQNLNINNTIHAAESTTHSVYAQRGQFRPHKPHPRPFSLKHGKQFANFRNINKFGTVNNMKKMNDRENADNKSNKLEEILHILFDRNKQNKETKKRTEMDENSSRTVPSVYAVTPYTPIEAIKASIRNHQMSKIL